MMVLYFKARPDAGDYTIYMGADKNENEELIKYGLPEDVWYVAARRSPPWLRGACSASAWSAALRYGACVAEGRRRR